MLYDGINHGWNTSQIRKCFYSKEWGGSLLEKRYLETSDRRNEKTDYRINSLVGECYNPRGSCGDQ